MENPKKRKRTGAERDRRKAELLAKRKEESANLEVVHAESAPVVEDDPEAQRIATRIPTAMKHLRGVFKQAKTWETGRLVKKIKGMKSKADKAEDLKDLEAQLSLLSHIRVTQLISTHLRSKISRLPQYRHSAVPSSITSVFEAYSTGGISTKGETSTQPGVRAKVENRLFSAKGVGNAVGKVMEWLVSDEGMKLTQSLGAGGSKLKRADSLSSLDEGVVPSAGKKGIAGDVLSDLDEDFGLEDEEEEDDEMDEEIDEAGWESGSIDDLALPRTGRLDEGDESDDDDDDVSDEEEEEEEDDDDLRSHRQTKPTAKTSAKDLSSSMFLPSLASGFTRGNDSDSDPDLDMDETGTIGKQRKGVDRKNRRGQRARQAIWEKKFGKHAKHVVQHRKDEAEIAAKKAERAEKRAAKYEGRGYNPVGTRAFDVPTPADRDGDPATRPSSANTPPAPHAAPKTVHPSWEAARLRKKQESAAVNAPKATKIVFD